MLPAGAAECALPHRAALPARAWSPFCPPGIVSLCPFASEAFPQELYGPAQLITHGTGGAPQRHCDLRSLDPAHIAQNEGRPVGLRQGVHCTMELLFFLRSEH